jgi:hypothetical protein
MPKEICLHPASESNFRKRLNQDIQVKKILEIIRTGGSMDITDEVPFSARISMSPRRSQRSYRKFDQNQPPFKIENVVSDIIFW